MSKGLGSRSSSFDLDEMDSLDGSDIDEDLLPGMGSVPEAVTPPAEEPASKDCGAEPLAQAEVSLGGIPTLSNGVGEPERSSDPTVSPPGPSEDLTKKMLHLFGLQGEESFSSFCSQFQHFQPDAPAPTANLGVGIGGAALTAEWKRLDAAPLMSPSGGEASETFSPFCPVSESANRHAMETVARAQLAGLVQLAQASKDSQSALTATAGGGGTRRLLPGSGSGPSRGFHFDSDDEEQDVALEMEKIRILRQQYAAGAEGSDRDGEKSAKRTEGGSSPQLPRRSIPIPQSKPIVWEDGVEVEELPLDDFVDLPTTAPTTSNGERLGDGPETETPARSCRTPISQQLIVEEMLGGDASSKSLRGQVQFDNFVDDDETSISGTANLAAPVEQGSDAIKSARTRSLLTIPPAATGNVTAQHRDSNSCPSTEQPDAVEEFAVDTAFDYDAKENIVGRTKRIEM